MEGGIKTFPLDSLCCEDLFSLPVSMFKLDPFPPAIFSSKDIDLLTFTTMAAMFGELKLISGRVSEMALDRVSVSFVSSVRMCEAAPVVDSAFAIVSSLLSSTPLIVVNRSSLTWCSGQRNY